MSEYVKKQALLDRLDELIEYFGGNSFLARALKRTMEEIQSGAFDANGEVQRLRAALGHIHATAQSELDELQYESQRKTWEEILLTAEEALKGDENA